MNNECFYVHGRRVPITMGELQNICDLHAVAKYGKRSLSTYRMEALISKMDKSSPKMDMQNENERTFVLRQQREKRHQIL